MTSAAFHAVCPPPRRARIAVLCGYMAYYESHMPAGYRAKSEAWGREVANLFADLGDILYAGLIVDMDAGHTAHRQLQSFAPDAIVVVPAMPSPAGLLWAALEPFATTPVVVWGSNKRHDIVPGYNSVDHLDGSGNVGVTMITNLLVRHARPVTVLTGLFTDPAARAAVRRAVKSAAIAGRLRHARIGAFGHPLDGYDNVTTDAAALAAGMGTTLVDMSVDEFTDAFDSIPPTTIAAMAADIRARYTVSSDAPEQFDASVRLALAVGALVQRYHLDAGSLNSHKEFGRTNPRIGLVGGFATTMLTTHGIPFTDTGDILTAIAMLLGRLHAGNALYCELNTIDYGRDMILCANTGEGDFANATNPASCRIFPTRAVTGLAQNGCTVCYDVAPGPATMIGFAPVQGARGAHRVIALAGAAEGTPDVALQVTHTWFRPAAAPAAAAFSRWAQAGATHHASLSLGADPTALRDTAGLLGIDFQDVTRP